MAKSRNPGGNHSRRDANCGDTGCTGSQGSGRRGDKISLTIALVITAAFFFIELVAGFYTRSLALLADAAHLLTDVAALCLSLFALQMALRPPTPEKTYGYLRAEILAALANGSFLLLVAIYIFVEAYHRMAAPPAIKSGIMLLVATIGLLANLVTAALLFRSQHSNLNIRGAYLHVLGDTLGSVGAMTAGIIMVLWHWYLADPIISVLVALLVLFSSWRLVRESVDILLEGTPGHVNALDVMRDLGSAEGVTSVHDLHVWSITPSMPAMSCHVVLRSGADPAAVLASLSQLMLEKYKIEHTTIQLEAGQRDSAAKTAGNVQLR